MAQTRKIMISLPDQLLREIDLMVEKDSVNRSEFIREAMRQYITERRRIDLRKKMRQGYLAMADINRELAASALDLDRDTLGRYEAYLAKRDGAERDKPQ